MVEGKHILIVDGDDNLRSTLAKLLAQDGYQVTEAGSFDEIADCLQAYPTDLVFLDLKLTENICSSILPTIRRLFPTLPFLILANETIQVHACQVEPKELCTILLKPVEPSEILANVERILQGSPVQD